MQMPQISQENRFGKIFLKIDHKTTQTKSFTLYDMPPQAVQILYKTPARNTSAMERSNIAEEEI